MDRVVPLDYGAGDDAANCVGSGDGDGRGG